MSTWPTFSFVSRCSVRDAKMQPRVPAADKNTSHLYVLFTQSTSLMPGPNNSHNDAGVLKRPDWWKILPQIPPVKSAIISMLGQDHILQALAWKRNTTMLQILIDETLNCFGLREHHKIKIYATQGGNLQEDLYSPTLWQHKSLASLFGSTQRNFLDHITKILKRINKASSAHSGPQIIDMI